jgi:hypothetical protein
VSAKKRFEPEPATSPDEREREVRRGVDPLLPQREAIPLEHATIWLGR